MFIVMCSTYAGSEHLFSSPIVLVSDASQFEEAVRADCEKRESETGWLEQQGEDWVWVDDGSECFYSLSEISQFQEA